MKKSTKVLIGTGTAAIIGIVTVVGVSHAGRSHHFGKHHAMSMKVGFHDMKRHLYGIVDANADDKITQSEIDAARADRRAKYDRNGDGELTLQELTGLWSEMTEPLKVRGFQFLDSDGNGKISKAEIDQRLAGIVKRFDRNGDGALSMEDRRRWHRSHHHDDDDDDDRK